MICYERISWMKETLNGPNNGLNNLVSVTWFNYYKVSSKRQKFDSDLERATESSDVNLQTFPSLSFLRTTTIIASSIRKTPKSLEMPKQYSESTLREGIRIGLKRVGYR